MRTAKLLLPKWVVQLKRRRREFVLSHHPTQWTEYLRVPGERYRKPPVKIKGNPEPFPTSAQRKGAE
jgi:hypothetical protein